jgi:hypothetical protein
MSNARRSVEEHKRGTNRATTLALSLCRAREDLAHDELRGHQVLTPSFTTAGAFADEINRRLSRGPAPVPRSVAQAPVAELPEF